eukprot:6178365-Pleurochrysis_carterae.AAC.2
MIATKGVCEPSRRAADGLVRFTAKYPELQAGAETSDTLTPKSWPSTSSSWTQFSECTLKLLLAALEGPVGYAQRFVAHEMCWRSGACRIRAQAG